MFLQKSVVAFRLRAILVMLVASCLVWVCATKSSFAETSPPQTSGVPISHGQIEKAITSLDAIVGDVMKKSGIPGMAIAVVHDGKIAYAKGFGVRKVGENQPIDANTVF